MVSLRITFEMIRWGTGEIGVSTVDGGDELLCEQLGDQLRLGERRGQTVIGEPPVVVERNKFVIASGFIAGGSCRVDQPDGGAIVAGDEGGIGAEIFRKTVNNVRSYPADR